MDRILTAVTIFLSVITVFQALRRGNDTAGWEWRWRALDPDERDRIAAAAISTRKADRETLVDPEERELAAGYRRRRRRRHAYFELPVLSLVLAVAALTVSGVVPRSDLGFALAIAAMFGSALHFLSERQIKRRPGVPVDPDPTS